MQNIFDRRGTLQRDGTPATECFLEREVPKERTEDIGRLRDEERALRKAMTPMRQLVVALVLTAGEMICLLSFFLLQADGEYIGDTMFRLWPLLVLFFAFFLAATAMLFWGSLHVVRVRRGPQMVQFLAHRKKSERQVDEAFGVPDDAKEIEVLVFLDEEEKRNVFRSEAKVERMTAFVRGGKLFLSSLYGLYAVPLADITATVRQKKPISVSGRWTEKFLSSASSSSPSAPPSSSASSSARTEYNEREMIAYALRCYYTVQIHTAKGEFGFIVLPWSIDALAAVADLKLVSK